MSIFQFSMYAILELCLDSYHSSKLLPLVFVKSYNHKKSSISKSRNSLNNLFGAIIPIPKLYLSFLWQWVKYESNFFFSSIKNVCKNPSFRSLRFLGFRTKTYPRWTPTRSLLTKTLVWNGCKTMDVSNRQRKRFTEPYQVSSHD